MSEIFNIDLLRHGPWQEFERNTARLLLYRGWESPQLVGRTGDGGADVIAVSTDGKVALFQCKFTTNSPPGKSAIEEVRRAGKIYDASLLYVVTSQKPTRGFFNELDRVRTLGLPIHHIGPDDLISASEKAPLYSPNRLELREYQKDAAEALRSALLDTGRAQLVFATGLGKTVVMAELVSDMLVDGLLGDGRVLVLAHTLPLVNQLLVSFWRHLPKSVQTHRYAEGERPITFDGITFATIQSFSKIKNYSYFDLVIVDEAHHAGAPDFLNTVEKINPPKLLGVTATPWRSDGVSINSIFGEPTMSMGIKEGLANGFLSEVDYRIFIDTMDWDFVAHQSQYGYTIGQLNKKLIIPTRDDEAIRKIGKVYEIEKRKRGLVFSPSQAHARSFASDLRRHGFNAAAITHEESNLERYKILSKFSNGEINFLCAVDVLNEGIDVPDVDMLVFMRVTHSRRIFVQQLGRGLRINPNKDKVLVLDFAADVRRIHAALDLNFSPENREIERLLISNAHISFMDKSLGSFFYEWIADLGNIQDCEDDEVIKLPVIDPRKFDFPETF